MKRVLLVLTVAAAALLGGATTSSAQAPAYNGAAVLNDSTADPGQTLTITATGCAPGFQATGTVNGLNIPLGPATVNPNGTVTFSFTVPAGTPAGTYTASVNCGAASVLGVTFTVNPASTGSVGGGSIPRTGDDSSVPLAQVGVALLALGCGAVFVAKRRHAAVA
jgi:LPXTG-motif cell wall-anchored protein